jgi:ribosomal-protein-alanine N-acetyltransferase
MSDRMSDQNWPVVLQSNELILRPLRFRDRAKWFAVRAENREWLTPWEATLPQVPEHIDGGDLISKRPSFIEMVRIYNRDGRSGRTISLAIWQGPHLIGQITRGGIIYGALRGGHIGYWIDRRFANRGFTTQAVEMVTAYGFDELGLHRSEINLRPENAASRREIGRAHV